jgi:hypothetical protein
VLQSIEKIYYIMREAQQAEAEGFSIIRIRTEPMDGAILVDVKCGADVLGFLTTKMPDFVKVLSGGEAVSLSSEMEEALEIAHIDQYESSAEQVSEYALQELVFRFMGDERRHYVKQLAPHFSELISSTLDVVTAE